jgi:Hemerythrin HHE cation binding domain
MTTNVVATHPGGFASPVSAPGGSTLVGEHARLLQGVHRRTWPVLALIDARTWPTAELNTLVGFLREALLRQASDEEALLFPSGAATPFAQLTAQHARLHAATERLAQANAAHCSLPQLRRAVADLVNLLARHLATEQALLAGLAGPNYPVPSAAGVASGAQTWLAANDAPLQIVLDDLPANLAARLCIERLLRLRPGQSAEVRSSDRSGLERVYRWMREFDTAGYRMEYDSADATESRLHVVRRRDS